MQKANLSSLESQFIVFTIDRNSFAIPVRIVNRIIPSIIITRVPGFQEHILGMVNVYGEAVPVFNIRKIFGLPPKDTELTDLFILLTVSGQTISFVVDSVKGIMNRTDQKIIPAGKIVPGLEKILEGLMIFDDGMILIYDPDKLFIIDNLVKVDLKKLGQKFKNLKEAGKKTPQKKRVSGDKKAGNRRAAGTRKPASRKTSKPKTSKIS